jgi:hypothetical protein
VIEAIFFIADDGFSAWRSKGIVRRSLKELAQALGVEESELQPRPDPHQYEAEQRAIRRARSRRVAPDINPWTGEKE